jgi:hypothetical protein
MLLAYPNTKQPWEEYFLGFDFSNIIGDRSIQSVAITAALSGGGDVTDTLIDSTKQMIEDPFIYYWVNSSSAGRYKITCRTILSDGSKYEIDATLRVVEL